ncbi:unnamed protein product [Angiostrongylus costaricensis]|uniref:non-specific serine/threonine protein kinase n=1 Tax=Angiostrongylus costaricensis TaxID=334426 RepID=A0A0R3PPS1_ANGCS|nr:unnamed protein product [Angiostrongylus costaricensis]
MAPSGVKPGVIKDPAVAALFSHKDPESRYDDLREIGHGSFGAVYFAYDKETSETVAIKKMAYSGKQAGEKWTDILKEVAVAFLNKVKHPHIVEYKACFLKEQTCWLIMEYCIGSAADIVDVLRQGLREIEISAICSETLSALHYLHQLHLIHRDIKAGNILLSDSGRVKLADFGSASMSDPAQTFIGTPFFMAPEVILAMDEGHYTEKADIWSLGITCIELAERRPPLFNMNAMSALYHIAQNDPPKLATVTRENQPDWFVKSDCFKDFVDICLRKEAEERPDTGALLNVFRLSLLLAPLYIFKTLIYYLQFIVDLAGSFQHGFIAQSNHNGVIQELITRTKAIVLELDNFQYKKMRKLMYLDEVDNKEGENAQGISFIITIDLLFYGDDMATLKKSKFSTLRSAKLISREQEEYNKENNMYEQMNGYKRLRQMHHKEIQQLEERCAADIELLRVKLDKELDQLVSGYAKERMRFKTAHQSELEKKKKEIDEGEKKLRKQILSLKERGLTRSAYEMALKDIKAQLTRKRANAEAAFEIKLRAELESEVVKYRRSQLLMLHSTEKRLDEEDLNVLERQMDNRQAMLLRHHEATKDIEVAQLKEIQTMKKRHQIIQHDAESTNQTEYTRRKTDDLRKRHAIQSRQQPRELKLKEAQIRKQFRQAVKTQARQFKLYQTQLMQATPKEEHKEISIQLKEKQKRRIALLTSQYEYQIESMVQEKTGKLESWQEEEARSLHERLAKELDELKEYQAKQRAQLENTIDKELIALDERIALRRAMLEQRFKEEREDMQKQRETHSRVIAERHAAEELQLPNAVSNSSQTTAL